jgi:ribosomal protein L11 methyltransferase
MCLAALEKFSGEGVKVLDLGCGSGILGIGALVLGCDSCFGVDIDPKAPDVVMSNAGLNGIGSDKMQVCAGDIIGDASLRAYLGTGYNLVLANIVADVIIPLSAVVRQFMAPDAVFICSGIIEHRWVETENALKANGFEILDHVSEEEWHCFVCK